MAVTLATAPTPQNYANFEDMTIDDAKLLLHRAPKEKMLHEVRFLSEIGPDGKSLPPYDPTIAEDESDQYVYRPAGYSDSWLIMEVLDTFVSFRTPQEFKERKDNYVLRNIRFITTPSDIGNLRQTPMFAMANNLQYAINVQRRLIGNNRNSLANFPVEWMWYMDDGFVRKPNMRPMIQGLQLCANSEPFVDLQGNLDPQLKVVMFPITFNKQIKSAGCCGGALKDPRKAYSLDNIRPEFDFWSEQGRPLQWWAEKVKDKLQHTACSSQDPFPLAAAEMSKLRRPWGEILKVRTIKEHIDLLIEIYGPALVGYTLGHERCPYNKFLPQSAIDAAANIERFTGSINDLPKVAQGNKNTQQAPQTTQPQGYVRPPMRGYTPPPQPQPGQGITSVEVDDIPFDNDTQAAAPAGATSQPQANPQASAQATTTASTAGRVQSQTGSSSQSAATGTAQEKYAPPVIPSQVAPPAAQPLPNGAAPTAVPTRAEILARWGKKPA